MFRFKRKEASTQPNLKMTDLDGNDLKEGDLVISLRYDLGKCRLVLTGNGFVYESLDSGEQVSWAKMIDARTELQKVRKIKEE